MKEFVTLEDVQNIYCISRRIVRDIIRHNRVHFYQDRDVLYINYKEFHSVYTTKYNPLLITEEDCKKAQKQDKKIEQPIVEGKENRTFFNIFTTPIEYGAKNRRVAVSYAG